MSGRETEEVNKCTKQEHVTRRGGRSRGHGRGNCDDGGRGGRARQPGVLIATATSAPHQENDKIDRRQQQESNKDRDRIV